MPINAWFFVVRWPASSAEPSPAITSSAVTGWRIRNEYMAAAIRAS